MAGTKFSVDLKGIDLTSDAALKIETQIKGAIFAELAKLDTGQGLKIGPLQGNSDRSLISTVPILGFVIEKLGQLGQLPTSVSARNVETPEAAQAAVAQLGTGQPSDIFAGAPLTDVVEALALRPDLRDASVAIARLLSQISSKDPSIVKTFEQLIDAPIEPPGAAELAPVVVLAYLAGCGLLAGVGLGLMSRPRPQPPQ